MTVNVEFIGYICDAEGIDAVAEQDIQNATRSPEARLPWSDVWEETRLADVAAKIDAFRRYERETSQMLKEIGL